MPQLPLGMDADDVVHYSGDLAANLARAYPLSEPTNAEVDRFRVLLQALQRCPPRGSAT